MKLLYITDTRFHVSANELFTGTRPASLDFVRPFLREFASVTVLARSQESGCSHEYLVPPVRLLTLPEFSTVSGLVGKRRQLRSKLRGYIRESDASVVRLPGELPMVSTQVLDEMGKLWAAEVVGIAGESYRWHGSLLARLFAPVADFRLRSTVIGAPFVHYVTGRTLQVVYPAALSKAVLACSDVQISTTSWRVPFQRISRIGTRDGYTRIGLIGTFDANYKGIDVAIKAASILQQYALPIEIRLLGHGDSAKWRRLAEELGVSDLVSFDVALPRERVSDWLDGLDLYIQPSRTEGMPRALIEAMSRGLPAIGSNCGGIPELLSRDCLVPPGSAVSLARAIAQAVTDEAWQVTQVVRNWSVAQTFSESALDATRSEFWAQFADSVRKANARS